MNRVTYCPECKSDQPHSFAADELGHVLWCRTCKNVHAEEICDACHYWHLGRCWHASAMLSGNAAPAGCQFRSARRAIPEPAIDF